MFNIRRAGFKQGYSAFPSEDLEERVDTGSTMAVTEP